MSKQQFEHLKEQLINHHRKYIDNDCTADPVFVVKTKQIEWGYEEEYSEVHALYYDCEYYYSVEDFLSGYDDEELEELFEGVEYFSPDKLRNMSMESFVEYVEEHNINYLNETYITHGNYKWVTHNMFLTREAAEEYVNLRCGGMDNPNVNIWTESWYRNYEMMDLLNSIMDGKLVWKEEVQCLNLNKSI